MIKLKIIYALSFILLVIFVITNNAYSEENNQPEYYYHSKDNTRFNIKFANTLSIEHFSNNLYRDDIRSKHNTILDKPAFNIDEKFQIILEIAGTNEENKPTDICCMSIPNSVIYFGINLFYSHYENFAIRKGIGLEGGLGDYKNPFLATGISFINLHDMVFDKGNISGIGDKDSTGDAGLFFNIGYKDDMHFFLDFSVSVLEYTGLLTRTCYLNLELALGYKNLIPLFFRIKTSVFSSEDDKINYIDGIQYAHRQSFGLLHVQYYGDSFGLSAGYSNNYERYNKQILNDEQDGYIDYITIDDRNYNGGGMTLYLKNTEKTFEFFGEFHVLADKDKNWITVSKFGTTIYF